MEIIDVTLRESVLCENVIDIPLALKITEMLSYTMVNFIEIGYLKNSQEQENPLLNYSPDYINKSFESCGGRKKLSAMIHPDDFQPILYDEKAITKLSLVRITCNPKNIHMNRDIINYFHGLGIRTSINLVRSSHYSIQELADCLAFAKEYRADCFYLADSNGHLLPNQVRRRIKKLKEISDNIRIGFHPHNNLGLATINSLEALKAGADMLDSSLLGYGKGAGNLRTEFLPIDLARIGDKYNIDSLRELFNVAKYFYDNMYTTKSFEEEFRFAIYGLFDIDLDFEKKINQLAKKGDCTMNHLVFKYLDDCHKNKVKPNIGYRSDDFKFD
jgi:4-hydroxy 2-oxovalerate aldolase